MSQINFRELDFQDSIKANEKIILEALGIPPILLDGGNNANIRPNHRLYYLETIIPIVRKIGYALERYFGFTLNEDVTGIPALQPELRDQAAYYATLVNANCIISRNVLLAEGYSYRGIAKFHLKDVSYCIDLKIGCDYGNTGACEYHTKHCKENK